jgi:hypothetical protein
MIGKLLGELIKPVFGVIDKAVTDKDLARSLKHDITKTILMDEANQLETKAGIIIAEASGDSWLQRSWRPITMLFFVGLVGAHWLGFTPANISETQIIALLDIVQIGLGGYVIGRSAEKVAQRLNLKGKL